MNILDKFRYKKDDPEQLNIKLDQYSSKQTFKNKENLSKLLSTSVRVSSEIFPNISKAIDNVFRRIKLQNNFSFFVTANHIETQATCIAMPLSDTAEIVLTSKLVELLSQDELESVIAHEIAHFHYQHALYPDPNTVKDRLEYLNLLHFSRAAEISADRVGFIGCGSLESSLRAMLKITSGLSDKHLKFNFSNYLDQLRELKEIKGDKNLMYSTHPNFLIRMQALIWFSMSNEYHKYSNTNKKGSFDLKEVDEKISLKASLLDFKIGYFGTFILAICFLGLGATTIYGTGIELESSGGGFAKQLIGIYTNTLGDWAYLLIALAAFTTMFSTTLTCLDAFSRVLSPATEIIRGNKQGKPNKWYKLWLSIVVLGTIIILSLFLTDMKAMVDFATKVAFITSPVIAILNYLVINGKTIPKKYRQSNLLKVISWIGMFYLIGFSIYFSWMVGVN